LVEKTGSDPSDVCPMTAALQNGDGIDEEALYRDTLRF
jgi:hypothetical protein